MIIRFRLALTLLLAGVPTALPLQAQAEPDIIQSALDSAPYTLLIDATCASNITIEGTPGQNEGAEIDETTNGLSFVARNDKAILEGRNCNASAHIHVRPGTAIIATYGGYGSLHVNKVSGPVSLTLSDSTTVTIDRATALRFNGGGFSTVGLEQLTGPGFFKLNGSQNFRIGNVDSTALQIDMSGFGSFRIDDGTTTSLDAKVNGSGTLTFNGTAETADLTASGWSTLTVERVTGALRRSATSASHISVLHARTRPVSSHTWPSFSLGIGWVLFCLFLLAAFIWRKRLTPHVLAPLRRLASTGRAHAGPARQTVTPGLTAPPQTDHPEVADLASRLKRIDRRIGAVEQCMTSRHFQLYRQLHDLDRHHG